MAFRNSLSVRILNSRIFTKINFSQIFPNLQYQIRHYLKKMKLLITMAIFDYCLITYFDYRIITVKRSRKLMLRNKKFCLELLRDWYVLEKLGHIRFLTR